MNESNYRPREWTSEDFKRLEEMRLILDKLIYQQGHGIELVFQFLNYEYLFDRCSQRVPMLRTKAKHYLKLTSPSAKEKTWKKIYELLNGIQAELNSLSVSRNRGGAGDQKSTG